MDLTKFAEAPEWLKIPAFLVAVAGLAYLFWFQPKKSPPSSPSGSATTHGANSPVYQAGRDLIVNAPTVEKPEPAFVLLDSDRILESLRLEVGKPPAAMFRVKNYGQSTAFNLVLRGRMAIGPALPEDFDYYVGKNATQPTRTSPPGEVSYWEIGTPTDLPVTQEQFARLLDGSFRFFLYGQIAYTDKFKNERWTNFSLALTPPTNPLHSGFGIQRDRRHNDTDTIGR